MVGIAVGKGKITPRAPIPSGVVKTQMLKPGAQAAGPLGKGKPTGKISAGAGKISAGAGKGVAAGKMVGPAAAAAAAAPAAAAKPVGKAAGGGAKGGAKGAAAKGWGGCGKGWDGWGDDWWAWGPPPMMMMWGPKGKGKDKGGKSSKKDKPAPPVDDAFWAKKLTEENRLEGDGSLFTGTVANYNFKAGWGFIKPDDMDSLPDDVRAKIAEAVASAKKKGKEADDSLLYFRKPDVAEGYKPEKGGMVTFSTYTDDKGAGACNVAGC